MGLDARAFLVDSVWFRGGSSRKLHKSSFPCNSTSLYNKNQIHINTAAKPLSDYLRNKDGRTQYT